MDSEEGKPGTVVWAKLAGFALWPARLAKQSEVSPTVSKAKRGIRQQLVYFFGSYDYAWVSQVQPWDENYERNIKGSKAKAFAKGLKEARQWLTARKHVFPVYQATSLDDEDSSESESDSASGSSSSDEEQLTSKQRGSTPKTGAKRKTAKGKQAISNRKGREASEGDAEGRRNAKRRRLEQRQTERQARDSDPEAMKRSVKRHAIQRRLGLCPPAGVREIVLLQRERKIREEEKDAAAATEKEKRAKQKAKDERKEEEVKKKKTKKKKDRTGEDTKKKDRTGKRDTKKRKRDKDLGDKKERPTKASRKKESTEEGKHTQAS